MIAFDDASFENALAEFEIEMEMGTESSTNYSGGIRTAENNCSVPGAEHVLEDDMASYDGINAGEDILTIVSVIEEVENQPVIDAIERQSEFEANEDDRAATLATESDARNKDASDTCGKDRCKSKNLIDAHKERTQSHCTMWPIDTISQNIDAGKNEMQSRKAVNAVKTELTNTHSQFAERKILAHPFSPRKRQLEVGSSPVYKRGRGMVCRCNFNTAAMYPTFVPKPLLQNTKPSKLPVGHHLVQSVQAPRCPLTMSSNGRQCCPICSDQLHVRNVPVRHTGKSTVPAYCCSKGHIFMRCFNNKAHTDLWECKRNRLGKLVHCCELCPKNKQKSVLCDHCLARFGTYTGASSFHPKENCPYYLREHPHLIKHSCLRTLRSLMAAGTMRKLRHPMYATVRMGILLELGDPRRV